MSNLKNILSSFKLRNTLNLKIWELSDKDKNSNNTPNNYKIYPEVRERLLEIAYRFIDSFDIDVVIDDIIITGSLVNFNWSKFSDVDLHVLINFKQFPEKHRPLYVELLDLKKVLFNLKYNIKVKGFDVELYSQDKSVTSFSSGVYSVLFDKWESFPNKEKIEIDKEAILNKTNQWTQIIDSAIEEASDKNLEDGLKILNKFKDKLKKYRTSGLEEGGEYSNENLVFKALRRNGYIGKLYDFKNKLMSNKLSLTESYLNEANTYGFPEGNVDSGKVLTGGVGGNWGGSMDIALEILSFAKDCKGGDKVVSSQKRSRKKTASGKVSDHYVGNLGAYAVDIPTSGKQGDELLACIMEKWNGGSNKDYKGGKWLNVNVGGYRYQFGWRVKDHYNHIHVGVKKNNTGVDPMDYLDKSGIDTDSEIKNELVTDAEKSEFLEELKSIAESDKTFKNLKEDGHRIPYDPDVEIIQTSLQFLGFLLPKWGVDGKFGPETEASSNGFKSKYLPILKKFKHLISSEKNVLTSDDIKVLYASLLEEGFVESDLSGIQKKSDFSNINIGNDKEFYEEILKCVGAPITDENLKFLYAWRQAENTNAANNPFATTLPFKNSIPYGKNTDGVQEYQTRQDGLEATCKTLNFSHYTCIVKGLVNDIGAELISTKCDTSLKKWGTHITTPLITMVLKGKIDPPPIATS